MTHPDKAKIRQSFERAALTYDHAAKVQRWVCARLAAGLPDMFNPGVILDAGCGTGFGLEMLRLRFPAVRPIALDFSPRMLSQVKHIEFGLVGDVEQIPLAENTIGMYWSSLTAQWCDIDALFGEAYRVLRPDGILALSSLTQGTFAELEQAFARVDTYRHTLEFLTQEALEASASRAGFRNIEIHQEPYVVHCSDLKTLLRAVKAVGANQLGRGRRQGMMGKGAWNTLEAAYEELRTAKGLPLTYQTLCVYAAK